MTSTARDSRDFYRLRADWLRFRNYLFDGNTGLPTLAAALDDVRRLVEDRGTVGLIYIDLGVDPHLEATEGWLAYDLALRDFAQALRELVEEGLLGSRDVIATSAPRSDKFVLCSAGRGGALADPAELAALAAHVKERLLAGGSLGLAGRFYEGYALLQRDPMLRTERVVQRALDEAMLMSQRRRVRDEDRRASALDALIQGGQITTFYQPIVDLTDRSVVGHEVFTRGPVGSPFESADGLFTLAERTGRLVEFERLSRSRSLSSARRHLAVGAKLFLNTAAQTLGELEASGAGFLDLVEQAGLRSQDVVLEVNEHVASDTRAQGRAVLRELKRSGFRIAIDDMGGGYASLHSVVEMEPDYMKFDVALVRNIDRSRIKRSLLETLVELSVKLRAEVIAEGIEEEQELLAVSSLGVHLGQGRYLGAPRPVPA